MNGIKSIQRVSEADLKFGKNPNASWHEQVFFMKYTFHSIAIALIFILVA